MYSIFRIFIACCFFVCMIMILNHLKVSSKRILYVIISCISVAIITILTFIPFENLFVNFDSPKEAYEYYNFDKSNIELVVEGDTCDFVVDSKVDSYTYLIIPKTDKGWKIGIGAHTRRIVQKHFSGIIVYVYQYKNTNDYFITIFDSNGGESTVSDDYNTRFYSLEKNNDTLGETFVTYYAHVSNFNSQYSVLVNGNRIVLN